MFLLDFHLVRILLLLYIRFIFLNFLNVNFVKPEQELSLLRLTALDGFLSTVGSNGTGTGRTGTGTGKMSRRFASNGARFLPSPLTVGKR